MHSTLLPAIVKITKIQPQKRIKYMNKKWLSKDLIGFSLTSLFNKQFGNL
jgi:hypothetical protein